MKFTKNKQFILQDYVGNKLIYIFWNSKSEKNLIMYRVCK